MRCFKFQFITVNPGHTFDDLSYDLADIFLTLEEDPFISFADMAGDGGHTASILIGTDILTIPELELILRAKLSENGRDPQNYIILAPETEEV